MRTLGICVGASSVQHVEVVGEGPLATVVSWGRTVHEGSPAVTLPQVLAGIDRVGLDRVAVTGRTFCERLSLSTISEPEAVEHALAGQYGAGPFPDLVASAGGETQLLYRVGPDGAVKSVQSGNKCASGTGEFFLQQIRRMDLSVEQACALAQQGTPHRIAGRCSVFCKSDCTHALNKGAAKADVVAGLSLMMAEKIRDLAGEVPCERMLVVGGGSNNRAMVRFLAGFFPKVETVELSAAFEAWGAALWALSHECEEVPEDPQSLVRPAAHSFAVHAPLSGALRRVSFSEGRRARARSGDECVVGLDVGSTTTKAVLMRRADEAVLADTYLRTNGDPVAASRACYRALLDVLAGTAVRIDAVGITGSGRQIAGLHALSDTIVNEIVAHATAAAYYDPEVDTIFEIGGQDAKYTWLSGGVPSDYAMNEACSAGTGSFLEEAAAETLGVPVEQIAELALQSTAPPDFRDECAAFISSDIKLAGQEGVGRNDILAGLVYSICLNYLNRVKGSRPVGRKVFMQGGVCYNRAVPVAMAACMDASIVVPPEPGLMGAFGAALEARRKLGNGEAARGVFDLAELARRDVSREEPFVCAGGAEKCDRKCEIARFRVDGKVYPFGGSCDRYYNLRVHRTVDAARLDFAARRQALLFDTYAPVHEPQHDNGRSVALNRSFMNHSLYPLFGTFFARMGFRVVLGAEPEQRDLSRASASFCLPALVAHASMVALLRDKPDYVFLPQVMQIPVPNVPTFSRLCVFVQGEPYYLKAALRDEFAGSATALLSPVLVMDQSYEQAEAAMVDTALRMGVAADRSREAWRQACCRQRAFERDLLGLGREALEYLTRNPDSLGVVLFGRPYNAMAPEVNMGISHKVASRGHVVLTMDMLDADRYEVAQSMFWASGQKILKAAQAVAGDDRLFGFYVTNFSCGPDSFVLSYFRDTMGRKPSLTLELDQHTANAGIDTRIEAALEIMRGWRPAEPAPAAVFRPARVVSGRRLEVVDSDGRELPLSSRDVEILIPPMGRFSAPSVAAIMRSVGMHARVLPPASRDTLLAARRQATCKECLPYLVTSGSFLQYLDGSREADRVSLLFIPTGGGPCRLGQYREALGRTIARRRDRNVAVLTVTDENGYAGLGVRALLRAWQAIVIADVFEDIRSMLTVAAKDRVSALAELDAVWGELLRHFEGRVSVRLTTVLSLGAARLARIPLAVAPERVPAVAVVGEYYVRKEDFSRRDLIDYLHRHGFMVRVAPAMEYLCYSNYNITRGLQEGTFTLLQRLSHRLRAGVQDWWEKRIKSILARSGLYRFEMTEVERTIAGVRHLVSEQFRGETLLTVGSAMREIAEHACGVISIGPFGCMPSRMAEAILRGEMDAAGKARMPAWTRCAAELEESTEFPFLSIETDGNPFPQSVAANLEAFVLQARRLHAKMAGTFSCSDVPTLGVRQP